MVIVEEARLHFSLLPNPAPRLPPNPWLRFRLPSNCHPFPCPLMATARSGVLFYARLSVCGVVLLLARNLSIAEASIATLSVICVGGDRQAGWVRRAGRGWRALPAASSPAAAAAAANPPSNSSHSLSPSRRPG